MFFNLTVKKRGMIKSTYLSYFNSYRFKIPTTKSCTKTKVRTPIISDSSARPIVFLGTKTHPETRKKSEKKIIMTKKLARKNIEQVRSRLLILILFSKLDLIDFPNWFVHQEVDFCMVDVSAADWVVDFPVGLTCKKWLWIGFEFNLVTGSF